MPYDYTTWPLPIFCIRKIHRLVSGSNPQPWVQKASDKPTTPPSRLHTEQYNYVIEYKASDTSIVYLPNSDRGSEISLG
ncbi:hypothetical protein TNCV_3105271 [Trichonephila clavipes]|nr:hypothetical protein TNCV_3105271 [Trichonephila clavipes]